MHRKTLRNKATHFVASAMAFAAVATVTTALAAPPDVRQADYDFDASGFVTPAGQVPPSMYQAGVAPVGFFQGGGCDAGCDGTSCDGGCASGYAMGGYPTGGGMSGCNCGACGAGSCGPFGCGGVLGKLTSGGGLGSTLANSRPFCLFCMGNGCGACEMLRPVNILGGLCRLMPYQEAGRCSQRWYDLSAEAVFLGHTAGGLSGPVTTLGTAPAGPVVLSFDDADSGDDLEAGMRLSAAMIFGAGGNLEATYMGNNQWDSRASVSDPGAGLFSFISDFGTDPANGFDDTDRSILQSIAMESEFHSGELNYRRRTMGPYCRFQGSWLVGLRYLRFDNGLLYSALGENNNAVNASLPRFFSSDDSIKNDLFGPQVGFDLWWNVVPGINLGLGAKGAWMQNDLDRRTVITANSINAGGPGIVSLTDSEQDTTVAAEFQAKLIYRLSHSWSFRTAYYAITIDDIGFATADRETIRGVVSPDPLANAGFNYDSLVVQGFSFGTEYIW